MDVTSSDKPMDRLTKLADEMTNRLDQIVATQQSLGKGVSDVKAIVFLDDDVRSGIVLHGWDDQTDAMVSLFMHMKAIFKAMGKDLDFVGIPETPEGAE